MKFEEAPFLYIDLIHYSTLSCKLIEKIFKSCKPILIAVLYQKREGFVNVPKNIRDVLISNKFGNDILPEDYRIFFSSL